MGASGGDGVQHTKEQERTLKRIIRQTADLKKEQYRIIGKDGTVLLEKRGKEHEVSATVGEKRDLLPGAISIHNHPAGGTFSDDDLNEFGFGATEMVISSPEGVYRLINLRVGKKDQYAGWYNMRESARASGIYDDVSFLTVRRAAEATPRVKALSAKLAKISEQWVTGRKNGASQKVLDNLMAQYDKIAAEHKKVLQEETRKAEVGPAHEWYKKNAQKYGFKYVFEPRRRK